MITGFIGRSSANINRGLQRVSLFLSLAGFGTFVGVYRSTIEYYIPLPFWLSALCILAGIGVLIYLIGYYDLKTGLVEAESVFYNKRIGWDYKEVADQIRTIHDTVLIMKK